MTMTYATRPVPAIQATKRITPDGFTRRQPSGGLPTTDVVERSERGVRV
jgi:hypothetical protein